MDKAENFRLADVSGARVREPDYWEPIVVPKAAIDAEVTRLAEMPRPESGRRSALIVHHQSTAPGLGFSPGVDVTINVLNPGEFTPAIRRNSSQLEICIGGSGTVTVGAREFRVKKWDVWNVPSMQAHSYRNDGDEVLARLSYSNAPLLEKLAVHFVEENPAPRAVEAPVEPGAVEHDKNQRRYAREDAPNIKLTEDGAWLRGYEYLVDIEVIENQALHWPWELVEPNILLTPGANKRPIMLLYNPATERRNGTTHSFFATMAGVPAGERKNKPSRGHRHSSVAINYWFQGSGYSIVNGRTVEWSEGDLMLSGPAWSEHAHYPGPDMMSCLTVQDHPLHIGMESLIWQEDMGGPILALGSEAGVTGYTAPRERGE